MTAPITPLPAPPPVPTPAGSIVLRSQSTRRSSAAIVLMLLLSLGTMALAMLLFFGRMGIVLVLVATPLFALPIGIGAWAIGRHRGTCTIVSAHGLTLRAPGAQARTIAWQEAHGRILVKVVTQHTPALVGSASMGFVCVAFDGGETPLPGTMIHAGNAHTAFQQSHRTALRILAYDPWRQGEPLTASESTYAPWGPGLYRPRPYTLQPFQ